MLKELPSENRDEGVLQLLDFVWEFTWRTVRPV
jgi:hypothetical protein